jgi:succinoglycan biosynthesis transport protein ExoP
LSHPLPAHLLDARTRGPSWGRIALFALVGAIGGALLGIESATLVTPTYRAAATLEYAQAPGAVPLSDASRDAHIDGVVESARSLAVDDGLRPERIGATNLIRLEATDPAPARANALAQMLVARSLADRLASIDPPGSPLETDLIAARTTAEQSETALATFRAHSPITSSTTADDSLLGALRDSLGTARGDEAAAASRAAAATARVIVSSGSVGQTGTASLGPLRTQRAELARRVAQLAERFDPAYPPLISARTELAALDQAIAAELAGLTRSAAADAAASRARATALDHNLGLAEQRRSHAIAAEADLARLQRAADHARESYRQLETSLVQRRTERSMARPELRLVTRATPPLAPASPQPWLLALFAALALALAGALLGWWREQRRTALALLLAVQ